DSRAACALECVPCGELWSHQLSGPGSHFPGDSSINEIDHLISPRCRSWVMCHHHHGLTGFINGLTQNTEDFSSASRVEGARRFVCKHHSWVANQRPGNCDTLLLSARKMHRIAGSLVGQPHQIEHFTDSGIIYT